MNPDENPAVTAYWLEHYTRNGRCLLCGNKGLLEAQPDPPAGPITTEYCICPNGQMARYFCVKERDELP